MGGFAYDGDSTFVKGGTDETNIGNIGDSIKVVAKLDSSSNNPQLDAFGRLRTSRSETIFDSSFRFDKQPITWTEQVSSSGTVTQDSNKASVVLACTTTTGSSAIFQSRQYTRYHPGKSQMIVISGNFIAASTNVTKRFGYYDNDNGVYFQLSGLTLSVVRRTKTSGSVVNNVTAQADWNIDKLDGTGISAVTLDVTKQQIFVIDFQWLGSGRIRYGFYLSGVIHYCHEENAANNLTLPWSQSGDAPIRVEISNAGSTAATMHVTCAAVICENAYAPEGILRTISNVATSRSLGAAGSVLPLISLRKQSAYVNVPIKLIDFSALANTTDDFLISIVYNGTLTGASWANVSGFCQRDVSATAISGGQALYSAYLRGAAGASSVTVATIFQQAFTNTLGRDVAGNSDIFTLVVTAVTSSSSIFGVINYKELI